MKIVRKLCVLSIIPFLLSSCELKTNEDLYKEAFDAVQVVKEENIKKLINLTKEDNNVIWNQDNTKVLMFAFHDEKDLFVNDTSLTINKSEYFLYSVKELRNWYLPIRIDIPELTIRTKQLLGVSYNSTFAYMSSVWVDVNDLSRAGYISDVTKEMDISFSQNETIEFKNWFSEKENEFKASKRPWTKLGYSYDWNGINNTIYGLSEFVAFKGTTLKVDKTYNIQQFYDYIVTL